MTWQWVAVILGGVFIVGLLACVAIIAVAITKMDDPKEKR